MFKLQRLEITGFKSFADYTEIVFTGSGITAVVGPNGCGKSNVSDAISWVLGEQRAKSLRGGEMKDVVFQGSRHRKQGGMAEVVLHLVRDEAFFDSEDTELEDIDVALSEFDEKAVDMDMIEGVEPEGSETVETNVEEIEQAQAAQAGTAQIVQKTAKPKRHWRPRRFALDFAAGEAVSVTRRLYLSGESEYQLNGKNCRLRDIQDLFAGTGLSGSHYAIIEQGRIGQILSAKPSDRRNLIEEAAGISKFRTRQRAAESRLDSAKSNLSRISDIVSEVDKQATSLRRQASKTRRFIVLQEEFRALLRKLFTAEGRHLKDVVEALDRNLVEFKRSEEELSKKLAAQEEIAKAATQTARDAEESVATVRGRHAQAALERDREEREHRYQNEQIVALRKRSELLSGDITAIGERLRLLAGEKERLAKDEEKESVEFGRAEQDLREAENAYRAKAEKMRAVDESLLTSRQGLEQHTAAVERFAEINRQLALNLERLAERSEGLKRESIRVNASYDEYKTQYDKITADLETEKKKLASLHEEKAQINAKVDAARTELKQSESAFRDAESALTKNRNRLETLQELEEKRAVYAPQVQKIFAAESKIGVKFTGVLADLFRVDESAEKAVENLFGNFLQTVLVTDESSAEKAADWIATNDVGRVAVFAVANVSKNKSDAVKVSSGEKLADILGLDSETQKMLQTAFPREMSARIVSNFSERKPSDDILVNFGGDIQYGRSLYISGKQSGNEKNRSLLAFKREMADLEKAEKSLINDVETAKLASEKRRVAMAELEEKTVDLQYLIIKVEHGLSSLNTQSTNVNQEIERAERHRKIVTEEMRQIDDEIVSINAKLDDVKQNSKVAEVQRADVNAQLDDLNVELERARAAVDAEGLILNDKRMLAATSSERRRSAQSALRRVENEESELRSRSETQNTEVFEISERLAQLSISIEELTTKIGSAKDLISDESNEIEKVIAGLTTSRKNADEAGELLAELNRRLVQARSERAETEVKHAESMTEIKNLGEKCQQELNIPLIELLKNEVVESDLELPNLRTETEDLRQRLDGFGAINMLAVDELEESEERLVFLTSQRQDIIDSIAYAEEALREIKERSRTKFKEAFERINENFIEFFQGLFGGGRGEMTLLEAEDVLEAGIEIIAQPPGKRLQNILLLSGGEKAMTAIALVLAIFKYRPAPFCLLDEVDAPLDEANVGRFVGKVTEMSENTQFIVITHNKRTMEAAKALYGVTMQEAGVSKVVSVKFE